MGLRHTYTATGTNDGTKQVSVTRWNEDHVVIGDLDLPMTSTPAVPPTDNLTIFAQKRGGRMLLSQIGPSGFDTTMQPHIGGNKISFLTPLGNVNTAPSFIGLTPFTTVGTLTARAATATNIVTRSQRLGYVSVATAGGLASTREPQAKFSTGAGDGLGGFYYRLRIAQSNAAAVAGERFFAGLSSSTAAATNVEPNTLLNTLGLCKLSTSNNLHMYSAGGTATTAIDLGADYPATTLSTDIYELCMFGQSNGSVTWEVIRLGTAFKTSGTFASVPANTIFLCHQIWKTNNATALAVGFDILSLYIETDY